MEELPKKKIFEIIDQLHDLGTERINLCGGEPLLRKDIGEIIKYIKNYEMECCINTNGYFVPQRIDELKYVDLVAISLDGNKIANDMHRGEGSFDKAIKALSELRKRGVSLAIECVLTKNNINSIDYLETVAYKYKCMIVIMSLLNQKKDFQKKLPFDDTPSDSEYRMIIKKIIEMKKKGAPILFSNKTLNYFLEWPFGYKKDRVKEGEDLLDFKPNNCFGGRYFGLIDVNGDVYPCCNMVGEGTPPNCFEIGIKKAWEITANHNCIACHHFTNNELNYLFSLDSSVMVNLLKNYKRRVS